jgi:Domain of unknown function (DUF4397)
MPGMTKYFRTLFVAALAVAILGGCSESNLPQATGKARIDALNAMPGSPSIVFLIEERQLGGVGYKDTLGGQSFDDLSYNFNFQYTPLGETQPTRIATHFIDMVADTDYTLVMTGSVAAPVVTLWERPEREFDGAETVFVAAFAHLSPALGDVDMYVAPTGTAPVLGEERAKLSYGDRVPEIELETGQYEVILTVRDDPSMILYQSHDTFMQPRISYTISIFDADPTITGNISVKLSAPSGVSQELPDVNFLPTLRTVHTAFGTLNFDIFRDMDFSAAIFSDLAFGQSTGDVPVDEGIVNYTYTEVGDPTAIINDATQLITRGLRTSTFIHEQAGGELSRIVLLDNRRPIDTHTKLRFIHTAFNMQAMDLYLVEVGTDITDRLPLIRNMIIGFSSAFSPTVAGDYEVIITGLDEKTPLLPPIPMNLLNGDVVEMIIMNSVDPLVPDVLITPF